jgi:uncharacterized protein (DUF433 family)
VTKAAVTEQNLVDVPLYTALDVARYLRVPVWLVACAWQGRLPHPDLCFEWVMEHFRHFELYCDSSDIPQLSDRWSFRQVADFYVRVFAFHSLVELSDRPECSESKTPFRIPWKALWLRPVPVFFGDHSPEEGIASVVQASRPWLDETAAPWLEKRLRMCLGRFDGVGAELTRLYPFTRMPVEGSPRTVVMDPRIRFGRPTVANYGTPTDIILERHQAGESIAELTEDYGIPAADVEEAIRFEARPFFPLVPYFLW